MSWRLNGGSVVVDLLFIVTPIVGVCNCSMFCCTLLYVPSSFAIILMGKRELVALLSLSSWCLVIIVWLFLAVPWVCLQFVIVVFPDHTHLLYFKAFLKYMKQNTLALIGSDITMVTKRWATCTCTTMGAKTIVNCWIRLTQVVTILTAKY